MNIDELKQYLEDLKNDSLKKDSHKYHSFYCVFMSHGNEVSFTKLQTDGKHFYTFRNMLVVWITAITNVLIFIYLNCLKTMVDSN